MTTLVACRKAVDIVHFVAEMWGSDSVRLSSRTFLLIPSIDAQPHLRLITSCRVAHTLVK